MVLPSNKPIVTDSESGSQFPTEAQDVACWQPWTPKVRDRVRVRLSGECQTFHLGSGHAHNAHELIAIIRSGDIGGPGYMGANGALGTVVAIVPADDDDADEGVRQHIYYVSDASEVTGHKWVRVDDFFAACELEPAS